MGQNLIEFHDRMFCRPLRGFSGILSAAAPSTVLLCGFFFAALRLCANRPALRVSLTQRRQGAKMRKVKTRHYPLRGSWPQSCDGTKLTKGYVFNSSIN